jgi:hypothetical protein
VVHKVSLGEDVLLSVSAGTPLPDEAGRNTVAQRKLSLHEVNWLSDSDDLEEAEWISFLKVDDTFREAVGPSRLSRKMLHLVRRELDVITGLSVTNESACIVVVGNVPVRRKHHHLGRFCPDPIERFKDHDRVAQVLRVSHVLTISVLRPIHSFGKLLWIDVVERCRSTMCSQGEAIGKYDDQQQGQQHTAEPTYPHQIPRGVFPRSFACGGIVVIKRRVSPG